MTRLPGLADGITSKGNFFAGRSFKSEDDLKARLRAWQDQAANRRIHGTTREIPAEVFAQQERQRLQPLPAGGWETVTLFDAGLDLPFLFRLAHGAGVDEETGVSGIVLILPVESDVVAAVLDHPGLEVVDLDPRGDAAEIFEGLLMASDEGGDSTRNRPGLLRRGRYGGRCMLPLGVSSAGF